MRDRRKNIPLIILVCLFSGAAVGVLGAASLLSLEFPSSASINEFKGNAAARGWPARTPSDQPTWPAVKQWSEWSRFGCSRQTAWGSPDGQTTHQIAVDRHGWPFYVFEDRQYWWPWSDPTWMSTQRSDPALQVRWDGVMMNGMTIGLPLALLVLAPSALQRRRRHRRGLCVECGYDLRGAASAGADSRCPECGMDFERPKPQAFSNGRSAEKPGRETQTVGAEP